VIRSTRPAKVLEDVSEGLVSEAGAARDYGVAIRANGQDRRSTS